MIGRWQVSAPRIPATVGIRDATAGGLTVYTVRATVTWDITWTGGGQTGTRPALTTTAAVDVRVVQAGTVNTGTAG